MSKKRILYIGQEMNPYLELTQEANTLNRLSHKMYEKGHEARVFMPRFGNINERKHRLHEVIRLSGINITVGENVTPVTIKVASLPSARMQVYFLDNEDYFSRRNDLHDDAGTFYPDNCERMAFFNKAVMEIILKLGWIPDIIHCSGWMTSLVPMYGRTMSKIEPVFRNTRFIYSIQNPEHENQLDAKFVDKAHAAGQGRELYDQWTNPTLRDLSAIGIHYADGLVISDPAVEADLQQKAFGCGKPVLSADADAERFAESHNEFYASLLEDAVLEKQA